MANKPRKRIDYAGWSVDIFSNDSKIDKLLDAHGWDGFGIYFFLCQMAFGSNGYFYEWCYDLCASTARKMGGGIGAGTVHEAVGYCLQIGLFDQRLFDRWGVLTSRGIQRSYLAVLKSKNRKGTELIKEFWLLDGEEMENCQGVVFVEKNSQTLEVNGDSLGVNADSLEVNGDSLLLKESKVKKSKVEESKEKTDTKHRHGEFGHVLLTDQELDRLFNDYGEKETTEAIKFLDEHIEMKGYKAKNHNLALRKWVFRAVIEQRQRDQRLYGSIKSDKEDFFGGITSWLADKEEQGD